MFPPIARHSRRYWRERQRETHAVTDRRLPLDRRAEPRGAVLPTATTRWTTPRSSSTLAHPDVSMCLCTLCLARFLRAVRQGNQLARYCQSRRVPPPPPGACSPDAARAWAEKLGALDREDRDRMGREVDAVGELSSPCASAHLHAAGGGGQVPPHAGSPALDALWFLLHRPAVFWGVFSRHLRSRHEVWLAARAAPGLFQGCGEPGAGGHPVGAVAGGSGAGAAPPETHRLPQGLAFVWASVSPGAGGARPGAQLCYYPADGMVLFRGTPAAGQRHQSLFHVLAASVLDGRIDTERPVFALDRLLQPFRPPPDNADMERVCVRSLELRYPERAGRRSIRLQAAGSDAPCAMEHLLAEHAGTARGLRVAFAELHIRLSGGGVRKDYPVRLWPDRCDVGRGPVGDRFLACLRHWGLCHE